MRCKGVSWEWNKINTYITPHNQNSRLIALQPYSTQFSLYTWKRSNKSVTSFYQFYRSDTKRRPFVSADTCQFRTGCIKAEVNLIVSCFAPAVFNRNRADGTRHSAYYNISVYICFKKLLVYRHSLKTWKAKDYNPEHGIYELSPIVSIYKLLESLKTFRNSLCSHDPYVLSQSIKLTDFLWHYDLSNCDLMQI